VGVPVVVGSESSAPSRPVSGAAPDPDGGVVVGGNNGPSSSGSSGNGIGGRFGSGRSVGCDDDVRGVVGATPVVLGTSSGLVVGAMVVPVGPVGTWRSPPVVALPGMAGGYDVIVGGNSVLLVVPAGETSSPEVG